MMTPMNRRFSPAWNDSELDPFALAPFSSGGGPTTSSSSSNNNNNERDAFFGFGDPFDDELQEPQTQLQPQQPQHHDDINKQSAREASAAAIHAASSTTSMAQLLASATTTTASVIQHGNSLGLPGQCRLEQLPAQQPCAETECTQQHSSSSSSTTTTTTPLSDLSARFGSSNVNKSDRQSMLARLYRNRSSARSQHHHQSTTTTSPSSLRVLSTTTTTTTTCVVDDAAAKPVAAPYVAAVQLVGSKRAFAEQNGAKQTDAQPPPPRQEQYTVASTGETTTTKTADQPQDNACPNTNDGMSGESLLHNSCKLYPTTLSVIESALQCDPQAIRRHVPVESSPEGSSSPSPSSPSSSLRNVLKRRRVVETFAYPINIALRHSDSDAVLELLAKAGPDVLLQRDGKCQGSSLAIALRLEKDVSVIRMLLDANPRQAQVMDSHNAYPLHVAARLRNVTLEMVKLVYQAFPAAVDNTNVRGETPVQVAERNPYCKEEIVNFLQDCAYLPGEENADHIEDCLLEQSEIL